MSGQSDAIGLSLCYESVEFETDANAPATMTFAGFRFAHCAESWAVDAELAAPRVTVDDKLGDEGSGAIYGEAGASALWMPTAAFALQPRLGLGFGQCRVSLPQNTPSQRDGTDLEWFQGNFTIAATHMPAVDSDYALSPSGGIGFRYVDGFHEFDDGTTREFDATLTYGFVGAHWTQCIGSSSRWALEAMAMIGQLEGFQVSFSFFF